MTQSPFKRAEPLHKCIMITLNNLPSDKREEIYQKFYIICLCQQDHDYPSYLTLISSRHHNVLQLEEQSQSFIYPDVPSTLWTNCSNGSIHIREVYVRLGKEGTKCYHQYILPQLFLIYTSEVITSQFH